MRGRVRLVALFADASDADIAAAMEAAVPDLIQLHGRETPERVAELRTRTGRPVIKAIAVADASDLAAASAYARVADMLLFDAKAPADASAPGGRGMAFDWQLLRGQRVARPWLLAGGLHAGNVANAIRACDAPGVDVSSGVESSPGVKDAQMIREFVAAARNAQIAEAS
jgi:phosphoribosylanthranilate isomerase